MIPSPKYDRPSPFRRPTQGWVKVPASVVENLGSLTHAETALLLIILRRTENPTEAVTVSDRTWTAWTGLKPRQKEYAIAGLKPKGLTIKGHGDTAKFGIERRRWEEFVTHRPEPRARTIGRRAVDPKPGAKIHPDCRDRGCALMNQAENRLSLVPPTLIAQPVARGGPVQSSAQKAVHYNESGASPMPATPIAQPVARPILDAAEQVWASALASLRAVFPWVGVVFLVRLVSICRALFPDMQDAELATAVAAAWSRKRRAQEGEGLFLLTVPEELARMRSQPKPGASPPGMAAGINLLRSRVLDALRARGKPFEGHVAELEKLNVSAPTADLKSIDGQMESIQAAIVQTARGILTPAERSAVAECVTTRLVEYRERMTPDQVEALRRQMEAHETLTVLGIPRLGLLYA